MPKQICLNNPERVECVRWSPGSCGRKTTGTSLILAALVACGLLQDSRAEEAMSVKPSTAIEFTAGSGQVFELQGSDDLKIWRDTGDVIFGEGDVVNDYTPSSSESGGYRFFRLKISPSQAFGFAPNHLPGKQIVLNDEGEAKVFSFPNRSVAEFGESQFAYSYRKLGDTVARLELATGGSVSERIDLDFSADLVGTYERTKFSLGKVVDIERGTFSLNNHISPSVDPPVTIIPESLVGLTFMLSDGDNDERIDLVSSVGGRAIDGAEVRHFTYEYVMDGESPQVVLHYRNEIDVTYDLDFGVDGCGTCVRRESVDGVLDQTSEGIFSMAESIYHTAGAESTTTTLPADELTGRTYVMHDGGTPCHLTFETQQTGRCTEGDQIDSFEFDYTVSCTTTSKVVIHFGVADYDAYHLNHTDRTFERHEIRSGVEQDIDTGTFSESP